MLNRIDYNENLKDITNMLNRRKESINKDVTDKVVEILEDIK